MIVVLLDQIIKKKSAQDQLLDIIRVVVLILQNYKRCAQP